MDVLNDLFEIVHNPNTSKYEVYKLNLGEMKRVKLGVFDSEEEARAFLEMYVGGSG